MAYRIEHYVAKVASGLYPGVLTGQLPNEVPMSAMTSTIQIFKRDEPKKWSKGDRSGVIHTAQCALLSDAGAIEQVGVLDIPESLSEKAQPGTYRGVFALQAAQFGDNRGKIRAVLTDLTPVGRSAAAAPAVAPGKAV